jgi:lysophospholipid acyltransferase (LPLAT)-like uncharacterized protein
VSLKKRLLGSAATQALAAWLIAGYIRLVHATSRWDYEGLEHLDKVRADRRALIACFWHQRILMMRFLWREAAPFSVLASPHRDGRLLARTVRRLGVRVLLGSSNRAGAAGLRTVIRTLRAGECVGITPDGPRGPRLRVQPGVVTAARAAGVPILPVAFGVRRRLVLGTWDRFVVALPFNRGVYVIGAPIELGDAAPESARRLIEERLNETTRYADRLVGAAPVEPEDPVLAPTSRASRVGVAAARAADKDAHA